ncbi:unnamed protein product, partial [Rotaria sp. Silwood2]
MNNGNDDTTPTFIDLLDNIEYS